MLSATIAFGALYEANTTLLDPARATPSDQGRVLYYDALSLGIEGQGWTELDSPYDRLPTKAKLMVRPRIWELSRDSAGLCVRFQTNAQEIHARWELRNGDLAMNHMPATGVSGLDLYVRTENGRWHWVGSGVPEGQSTTTTLVEGLAAGDHEFMLYLPLYNGVKSLEIGIPKLASLRKATPRSAEAKKPIVFYGTSITQGGCASRPGMCYSAIVGRRLDSPVINLGFSSNGTMDLELATLIGEVDSAAIVIDCVPNMTPELVAQRTIPFVEKLRSVGQKTPILLVEDRTFANAFLVPATQARHTEARSALRKAFDSLVAHGDHHIAYVRGETLLNAEGDDTVDGSHATDLGFVHISDAMVPPLRRFREGKLQVE